LALREQRELLARVYFRRGFTASAAQEWMAVCSEQPDARALIGLARIARRQGLEDDAKVFAREALVLEPDNDQALALLPARERAVA
jgi:Tfp pilus assembly protein PilF